MQKSPKVSVLIPVYNASFFIVDAVNSILNQSYKDFELILLDDGSTDDSLRIISQMTDDRIKVFKNKNNMGISFSRNKLIDLSKGEYLAIMDNDDLAMPNRLKEQVDFLDKNKDVSVVGARTLLFCNPSKKINRLKKSFINLGWVWCQPQNISIKDCQKASVVMHTSAMLRKIDIVNHNIKYNKQYTPAEDYDLWRQVLFAGLKIVNLPMILQKYNLHGQNFSVKRKENIKKADKAIKDKMNINYKYPYLFIIIQKLRLKLFLKE